MGQPKRTFGFLKCVQVINKNVGTSFKASLSQIFKQYPCEAILATTLPPFQVVSKKCQIKRHERTFFLFSLLETFSWVRRFTENNPRFDLSHFKLVGNPSMIYIFRFFDSRYSFLFERREGNSGAYGLGILSYLTRFTRTQPRAACFVAYFRPDIPNILFLICCPAHLKQEVIQDLENRDVTRFADGSSMKDMIPGEDKAFVSLSGGIRPFDEEDVNSIYLR